MTRRIRLRYKKLVLWERYGFLNAGVRITQEKIRWNDFERFLLFTLGVLQKKKAITQVQINRISEAMAESHKLQSEAFTMRLKNVDVIDIEDLLKQIIC